MADKEIEAAIEKCLTDVRAILSRRADEAWNAMRPGAMGGEIPTPFRPKAGKTKAAKAPKARKAGGRNRLSPEDRAKAKGKIVSFVSDNRSKEGGISLGDFKTALSALELTDSNLTGLLKELVKSGAIANRGERKLSRYYFKGSGGNAKPKNAKKTKAKGKPKKAKAKAAKSEAASS